MPVEQLTSWTDLLGKYGLPLVVCTVLIAFCVMWLSKILFPSMRAKAELKAEQDRTDHELALAAKRAQHEHEQRLKRLAEDERKAAIELTTATRSAVESIKDMQTEISRTQRQILDPVQELLRDLATLIEQHADHHKGWPFETVSLKHSAMLLLQDFTKHGTVRPDTARKCLSEIESLLQKESV